MADMSDFHHKPPGADVVIGAGFGDEGKGILTDALAARGGERAVVIRFNGGAQAGHTVTLADGRRHVFHHVGAGAFAGAATHLSRFFVANPILLGDELAALERMGIAPRIGIDPGAPVTTPYDMMINQIAERARGDRRHGSCGLGFGETLERNLNPEFALTAGQLPEERDLRAKLELIRTRWAPARLAALGIGPLPPSDLECWRSEAILAHWLDDVAAFRTRVELEPLSSVAGAEAIVFEGAQGLQLDQDYGAFPHVTRSNTGLKNVALLVAELGLQRLRVTHVTRAYATRHGAGYLPHERPASSLCEAADETNVANAWQGALRYGALDLDALADAIGHDLGHARRAGLQLTSALAMTCLDQVGDSIAFVQNGRERRASPGELAAIAADAVRAETWVEGWGPRRGDLKRLD